MEHGDEMLSLTRIDPYTAHKNTTRSQNQPFNVSDLPGSDLQENHCWHYTCEPSQAELNKGIPGHPAELHGIPNHLGTHPRIIVFKKLCEAITIHTHEDIHHQNHQKALIF
jgi:hypothetical protein